MRVAVGVVLAVAVVLRFVAVSHLWLDEALTVNVARLPLDQIPEALRHDGAPPLYYVLLHGWMRVLGTSELAVRALSGVFAVAALPLIWVLARRMAGIRVAWAALLILAASPFSIRYATEVRMYSLVVLLVLGGTLALVELLDRRSTRAAVGLGLCAGLLLYTHYWSIYLLATVGVLLTVRAMRGTGPERAPARRAVAAIAAGCLLFLPWLPSFLSQLRNTGTPWGASGNLRSLFDTVTHFAGGYWDFGIALGLVYFALLTLGVLGRAVDDRIEIDLRGHAPGPFLATVLFGTLAVAVVAGRLGGSAYAVRYAAVILPVLVLLMAIGTEALPSPRAYRMVLGLVVVLGFAACIPNVVGDRTSAARVASALREQAQPGDVVAYCPDQLGPSVSRLLPAGGLDQLTFPRSGSPQFVDWVGYEAASKAASPAAFARMLVERAGTRDIWVVWAPGYRTFKAKCQALLSELHEVRPENTRVVKVSTKYLERPGLARFPA